MPVREFFEDQLDQLREFMADPGQTVRIVAVDSDLKPVLVKMLSGLDRDPNTPHVLIPSDAGFRRWDKFFPELLADLLASYESAAVELLDAGVYEPFGPADLNHDPPEKRVSLYLSALAEGLPDHVGSLVVVLDPKEVTDAGGFRQALVWLAENTWSPWVKYLVIDNRLKPRTTGVGERNKRIVTQTFYLPPEEFERRLRAAVDTDASLPPNVRRQYTGMLGGFALAREDFDLAAECYGQQAELTQLDGVPGEEAQAHYCLGNVRLYQADYPAAEEAYARALELSLRNNQTQLTGLVLTQLGIVLRRLDRSEEAAEAFRVARETARTGGFDPMIAFALDTEAQCHAEAGDNGAAERCWKEALAVYDGMTGDAITDMRDAGRNDILRKLDALHDDIRRPGWSPACCPPGARRGA